jgi:hypothetical protein
MGGGWWAESGDDLGGIVEEEGEMLGWSVGRGGVGEQRAVVVGGWWQESGDDRGGVAEVEGELMG